MSRHLQQQMAAKKLIAFLLSLLLGACSAARYPAPGGREELSRFVLVIREELDGQVSFTWRHAESFDFSQYGDPSNAGTGKGRIVLAATRPRDCHAEYLECIEECMRRPLPRGYGHITAGRGLGGKEEYCRGRCRQPYMDCEELQRLKPQEFSAWDGAVDWLKRNHRSVLIGSVVVIAGVAFVVVSAGTGVVILAPAVLLATAGPESEPYPVEGGR